jgi:hypothetical protein
MSKKAVSLRAAPHPRRGLKPAVLGLAVLALSAVAAYAQPDGGFGLNWWTVDAGGGTSSGGIYAVRGTAGQSDVGTSSGATYTLRGGFWGVAQGACTAQFTDVPPGSTFHSFVICLACRNILSGYADGTFRPNANVTRGQLSKIVSNSAGYSEPHPEQTFEDVTVGSTFHEFIERLASRGHISGYPCGGPGEPCIPPGNRPYFRPNADVTRGQTSKIAASAANLPAPPPGQQTFQDVPVGSTFWTWIEALATTGAINGYPCGGSGEPCVPPENRPYFRPFNNVTRGQSSKIVANTFFPSCGP